MAVIKLVINVKKGDIVRQLVNTQNGDAFIRTATMNPNSPAAPISAPSGYVPMSYVAEHDTQLVLNAHGSVMDNDNNPYAQIIVQ